MKIGIVGDTHGDIRAIRKILQVIIPVDYWFHTGDYSQDAKYLVQETGLPLLTVAGNCDGWGTTAQTEEFILLEEHKIWLTHGHRYMRGRQASQMADWGHKLGADIVVFGHIHQAVAEWYGNLLLINPGSASQPKFGEEASYAVLTLTKGERPEVEIFDLDGNVLGGC